MRVSRQLANQFTEDDGGHVDASEPNTGANPEP